MKKVAIIDYNMGNLFSVEQACFQQQFTPIITDKREIILNADALILPGVGAFKEAMEHLSERGLIDIIHKFIASGKPFMGICLGMQLLFESSEEFGHCEGLGVLKGTIRKFQKETEGIPTKLASFPKHDP